MAIKWSSLLRMSRVIGLLSLRVLFILGSIGTLRFLFLRRFGRIRLRGAGCIRVVGVAHVLLQGGRYAAGSTLAMGGSRQRDIAVGAGVSIHTCRVVRNEMQTCTPIDFVHIRACEPTRLRLCHSQHNRHLA